MKNPADIGVCTEGLNTEAEGTPCIRLARGKFELTSQDSAGGET